MASVSNARLNATGAVLCRIKCDSPCHIICDWAQFQAEIRTLGEARQCGEARSRICQISMPWWVLLLVEAETRHKLGDFSQSQIIWQPQSRLMWRLTSSLENAHSDGFLLKPDRAFAAAVFYYGTVCALTGPAGLPRPTPEISFRCISMDVFYRAQAKRALAWANKEAERDQSARAAGK